jgi:hypothetical protein
VVVLCVDARSQEFVGLAGSQSCGSGASSCYTATQALLR